jgi:hypothetical protein
MTYNTSIQLNVQLQPLSEEYRNTCGETQYFAHLILSLNITFFGVVLAD